MKPDVAIALALLGVALAICPAPKAQAMAAAPGAQPRTRPAMSTQTLKVIVAIATVAGCVALTSVTSGLLISAFAAPVAAVAVDRLAQRPDGLPADARLAVTLDLIAAGLRAGQPVGMAVALAAPAAGSRVSAELLRVSGLLRLGEDPNRAWGVLAADRLLAPVAEAARRSARSGVRVAEAFERLAADVRADLSVVAQARANRAGIYAMAPLGLCFLPAFICLGVVPVVVGIAKGVFTTMP